MKKYYWLLAVVLVCGLLLTGCPQHYDWRAEATIPEPQVEYIPLKYPVTTPEDAPEVPLSPSIIEFDTVRAGGVFDIWTQGSYVEFGENIVKYKGGSQLCLFLVNDNGEEKTYNLQWLQARKPVVFAWENDGKGYANAPYYTRDWVWFPSEVTVQDGYIARIPIVINIPKDAEVPDTWAFRIGVVLLTSDFIELKSSTYFLLRY